MQRKSAFSRRIPDLVTEEIVAVLKQKKGSALEFKQLFDCVYDRLKKRNAASGGEEMLRLRAYEKLKQLVDRNMVRKLAGKVPGQSKYKAEKTIDNALAPLEPPRPPASKPVPAVKAPLPKKVAKTPVKKAAKSVAKPAKKVAPKAVAKSVKKAPAKPAKKSKK